MTDPAVEAAERATQPHGIPWVVGPGRYALHGAREALAPIRDLHRPRRKMHAVICDGCRQEWPCDTARHAYSDHELEAHQ